MFLINPLRNNPKLLVYITAFMAASYFGWHLRGQWDEGALKTALESQEKALHEQCDKEKAITSEVSHDYQTKISALNSRIGALKRLQQARCVPVTSTTGGHNGTTTGTIDAGTHGVASESLIDYAGEAEKYRLQLLGCQDFVRRERQ